MFYKCIGVKTQEEYEKLVKIAKEEGITFDEGYPTQLFSLDEAKYRITELYEPVDCEGNAVEVTEEMIRSLACELDDNSEDYIDGEEIDMIVSRWAKSIGLSIGF